MNNYSLLRALRGTSTECCGSAEKEKVLGQCWSQPGAPTAEQRNCVS